MIFLTPTTGPHNIFRPFVLTAATPKNSTLSWKMGIPTTWAQSTKTSIARLVKHPYKIHEDPLMMDRPKVYQLQNTQRFILSQSLEAWQRYALFDSSSHSELRVDGITASDNRKHLVHSICIEVILGNEITHIKTTSSGVTFWQD